MATTLKNILSFAGLAIGVPTSLPHLLNIDGRAVLPDLVAANAPNFTITANATNVTVTRTAAAGAAVDVYVEHWHTIERDFGSINPVPGSSPEGSLVPQPFVIASGDGGAGTDGVDVEDEGVPLGTFTTLNFVGAGVTATDAGGGVADVTIPGAGGVAQNGVMFFGQTAGTGSGGTDYAATVAVGAPVPFPQNGPVVNGGHIVRDGVAPDTAFVVVTPGVYEVSWAVAFVEASQLQLTVDGLAVPNTNTLSGAGTQQNTNTVLVDLAAGETVRLINPAGNAAALTVQTADGTLTHAQAPNIVFKLLG